MANTNRATAPTIKTMETLAQKHLVQIADLAHTALTGGGNSKAALKSILRTALASMNALSAEFELAGA